MRPFAIAAFAAWLVSGCASAQQEPAPAGAERYVYVVGETGQRGRIPLEAGRKPFTLVKLVATCGGFTPDADTGRIRVVRLTETGRSTYELAYDDVLDCKRPDFELRPDDVVFVPTLASRD